MKLLLHDSEDYSVIKFPVSTPIPEEFIQLKSFKSVTYTSEECSFVVPSGSINADQATDIDAGWFIIQIAGELDFSLVGILTQLANPLAENNISIFALSTYNTDYLLIKNKEKTNAVSVLEKHGHIFI